MITVERLRRIVSGMHILTAGLVDARQSSPRMRGIFGRHIVVSIDVMMIEIERDLKIVGYAVFEFLAKIDHAVAPMLFFPARGHPLLELTVPFRSEIGRVGPGKDRFVCARSGAAEQQRGNNRAYGNPHRRVLTST